MTPEREAQMREMVSAALNEATAQNQIFTNEDRHKFELGFLACARAATVAEPSPDAINEARQRFDETTARLLKEKTGFVAEVAKICQPPTDRLTEEKAAHIIQRDGYAITGYVLAKPDGQRCVVEQSAVRWLTKDEAWNLMHPSEAARQQAEPESVIKRQAQKIGELIADRDSWIEAHARLYRLYHDQSPKAGEEIHVNVEGGDVYTLPLQLSGMDKPRFVVHVPRPQQQAEHVEFGADCYVIKDTSTGVLVGEQQAELNQCDGCQSAAPIQNGKHVDENGYAFMVCQRYRYEQAESQSIYQEQVGNGLWQDVSKELHDAIKDGRVRGAVRTVCVTQQAEPKHIDSDIAQVVDKNFRGLIDEQQAEPGADERAVATPFLTTQVDGDPDPAKQRFRMVAEYRSLEGMYQGHDLFVAAVKAAQSSQRAGVVEDAARLRYLIDNHAFVDWCDIGTHIIYRLHYTVDSSSQIDWYATPEAAIDAAIAAAPTQQQEGA